LKLLLDQNLSHKLVTVLEVQFPGTSHVLRLELDKSSDSEVRDYAQQRGFTLATKNTDMVDLCVFRGAPPKVLWLRLGNCSTTLIHEVFERDADRIRAFIADDSRVVLSLFRLAAVE